jgi:hypothetical protein
MSDLNQIITVQIDRNTTTPTQVGFGTPLILGYFSTSIFPERVRTYSTLAELVDDGFATTDPVYVAASDLLAQNPSPPEFKVGRRALPSTLTVELTPSSASIVAGEEHTLTVTGPGATTGESFDLVAGFQGVLTVAATPTTTVDTVTIGTTVYRFMGTMAQAYDVQIGSDAEESIDNLVAAINLTGTAGTEYYAGTAIHPEVEALKLSASTMAIRHKAGETDAAVATTETFTSGSSVWANATTQADTVATILDWFDADIAENGTGLYSFTDGATKGTIAASTAGNFFAVRMEGEGWTFEDITTDPGVATDLAAIELYDNDWYALVPCDSMGAAELENIAEWTESATKICLLQTADSEVASVALASDTSSIAYTLKNANYDRAMLFFHRDTDEYVGAAMGGRALPEDAGSITWAYKQLSSVSSQTLTTTERTNLENKNVNFLSTLAGVAITRYGKASGGEFIDVMHGTDWLAARIQERVYTLLLNNDKLPYTDAGIQAVRAEILAQLDQGIARNFIASDPAPTCTVPLASDVSAADKSSRTLNDVMFRATLAGAIHKVAIEGELNL